MRITEVEVIPVAHREPPLLNAWGIHSEQEARTILRLTTADGTVGISETYGSDAVINELRRVAPTVEKSSPHDRKKLELRMQRGQNRGGVGAKAFAAYETAMLDLIGRATGTPMYDLLGGKVRDEVEFSAYLFFKHADRDPSSAAIAPQEVLSPEAMVEEAREFVETHGFETLKLKAGVLSPEEEVRTLELLAEKFGRDVPLRIDPNGNWSVETATKIAKELDRLELNVEFLEDPVPTMNAHARLKRNTKFPVATNMYVTSFNEVSPAVSEDAVDVVLSDHHYWGGPQKTIELDRLCRTFDLGVGMHSNSHLGVSMAAMAHTAAAMPTVRYACDTHYPWEADDVIVGGPIEFEDGVIPVSDDPGLGVKIDENAVDRLHEAYTDDPPERDDSAKLNERRGEWVPNAPRF
ncbi:enolase C-terminal domain-like protein [Haloferax gibbonsii]|uniref:glucarate dehydratase n=1 Tax=Haloferax gibbonsii TaxID=35746 RepID=A0A0K1IZD9_HALGI|nr:enolase C-terminal domain-like protein [Haloferax gibbonsii]AKU09831.1 hypothetical protein ABY42_18605 [Haloferax gibbonsii]